MSFMRWIGVRKQLREESPLFRFTKQNLNAGEHYIINLASGSYAKYSPYNYIQITNMTDRDLILFLDTSIAKTIPKQTIISMDSETIKAFRYVDLYNPTSNTATGEVEILVQKVKSAKDILREVFGI